MIIVLLGKSRSGKDSFGSVLEQQLDMTKVKFADPFKRIVEQHYSLPNGAMEDPVYRNAKIPGRDITYLDLLKINYDLYEGIDSMFWRYPSIHKIQDALRTGRSVLLTDVRHPREADIVANFGSTYDIYTILIEREGCPEIAPDRHLRCNWDNLKEVSKFSMVYNNNGSMEELKIAAETIAEMVTDKVYL